MKFHHIGVAVKDIDTALKTMLGTVRNYGKVWDGGQRATLCMTDWNGLACELVEGEPVDKYIDRVDCDFAPYHVCFEVDNILDAMQMAYKSGYFDITSPMPAPLFDDRIVVFVMNNHGTILEFLESPRKETVRI